MINSLSEIRSIYCTFPSTEEARKMAQTLLSEHLIACANIFPPGQSMYVWGDKLQDEEEVYAFFKTSPVLVESVAQRIKELHPYETPAIIIFKTEANQEYGNWIHFETKTESSS